MNKDEKLNKYQNFYEKYKEKILPKITEIEKNRQSFLKNNDNIGYKKYLKTNYLKDLLSCIEDMETISINNESYNSTSDIFKCNNKINDIITGTYKNVKFYIAEVSSAMVLGKKGVYSGPWNGVILEIEFNKPITKFINISPRKEKGYITGIFAGLFFCFISFILAFIFSSPAVISFYNLFFPTTASPNYGLWIFFVASVAWTSLLTISFIKSSMDKINLEDVNFEKKYYVEAQNQVEARYILTPTFIDRLNDLKTIFQEKNTWISFNNNKVTFSFETDKDLFELGNINVPITSNDMIEQFYNEITEIIKIIDYFKLNQKLGL